MSNRIIHYLEMSGFNWLVPMVRMARGENIGDQARELFDRVGLPLMAIALFLALWAGAASQVKTSLGELPGPVQVWEQAGHLWDSHVAERVREQAFLERQAERNAARLAANPDAQVRWRSYTGKPTFVDQILTSLKTVFAGFLLASVVAIPIGIACGLSKRLYGAISPLVQILKPVSPLAWLPIVTMVVSAVYVSESPLFQKSFITSAITVMLCSLWPTLINTAVAVASIDRDWINVGRVIRLPWTRQVFSICLLYTSDAADE